MVLMKYTTAWEVLNEMADEDENGNLNNLVKRICDAGRTDALDNIVSYEFPNGVEEDELREYFENEQDEILKDLGIEDTEDGEDD